MHLKFHQEKLVGMIAVHVDDLKVGGKPWVIKDLLSRLEKEFGKLTVTMYEFTNTGVHHKQHGDGSITLDQHDYIDAMRPTRSISRS